MTPHQFRELALSFDGAEEREHGGHPDFRVNGKIFATLGYPDESFGVVVLSPEEQNVLVQNYPKAFVPVKGKWGEKGSTTVILKHATKAAASEALELAWERRRATAPRVRASGRGRAT